MGLAKEKLRKRRYLPPCRADEAPPSMTEPKTKTIRPIARAAPKNPLRETPAGGSTFRRSCSKVICSYQAPSSSGEPRRRPRPAGGPRSHHDVSFAVAVVRSHVAGTASASGKPRQPRSDRGNGCARHVFLK